MTAPSPASMPVPREVRPDQLAVTYPAFAITCQPRGWRGVQWEAIRKNGAEPGLYAVITADLAELGAVLAAAAGPGGAGSHGGPGGSVVTAPAERRPLPGCAARHGQGASIAGPFTFAALDTVPGPGGEAVTEVLGWFGRSGGRVTDCVLAAGFDVPAGSVVARAAREIAGSPVLAGHAGDRLRASVLACPGTAVPGQCPALDAAALITAIRHAVRTAGWPQPPRGPGLAAAIASRLPQWVTR